MTAHAGPPGTYRTVLRNRIFLGVLGLNVVLVTAGIAQLEVLPAFVTDHAGVSESGVGWIFFVNTVVVVALQMPLARVMAGHRRMPSLAAVAVLWAASWALVPLVADAFSGAQATVLLAGCWRCSPSASASTGRCRRRSSATSPTPADRPLHGALGALLEPGLLRRPGDRRRRPRPGPERGLVGAAAILLLGGVAAMALEPSLPHGVRRSPKARPAIAET